MSLEKMIYYAQCFHLVLHDAPLFPDEILAWQKGPVVGAVYSHYAGFGWNLIIPDEDAGSVLPEGAAHFLKQIVSFFGRYTAIRLSEATHLEDPWRDARDGIPPNVASGIVIPQVVMKSYYRALINEGEAALSRHELLGVVSEPRWASFYLAGICARHMTAHPLYEAALAKRLSDPVAPLPNLPDDFYAPPKKKDFVEFRPGDDVEAIIKRSH
jgi:uncharacterized phage-associated protein